jgi:hypothetical protein
VILRKGRKSISMSSLKTSDYYTKDIGTWGGKGAEMLGLKGEVERKDFVALIDTSPLDFKCDITRSLLGFLRDICRRRFLWADV